MIELSSIPTRVDDITEPTPCTSLSRLERMSPGRTFKK
jgi:hypothetical protein